MAIVILSTGGTISSVEDEGQDAKPELGSRDLVRSVPELEDVAEVETEEFATTVSHHFTIDGMARLAHRIVELDKNPDVDGVVVTQGTNTLETVSYFVDLCYDGATPVVFTGAMRNPSIVSPDGPANLLSAVRTAASDDAGTMGVLVTFNFRIHTARGVTKAHTQNPDSFRTPEFGPIGIIAEDAVVWRRKPAREMLTFEAQFDRLTNNVPIVPVAAEIPPTTLEAARDSDAVCLVTFGPGHLPPTVIPTLETFLDDGPPVVASSWCAEGVLARNTYECYGCESTTRDLCYYSELNPRKTRILTIVSLAAGRFDEAFVPPES